MREAFQSSGLSHLRENGLFEVFPTFWNIALYIKI
jgi:hypothetical protein